MSDEAVRRQADKFFATHIQSQSKIDDIKALEALLPDDPAVLHSLGSRCMAEAHRAMRAGNHLEGRRLDVLGRQIEQRAEQTGRRRSP
jgi:hypothetical protein